MKIKTVCTTCRHWGAAVGVVIGLIVGCTYAFGAPPVILDVVPNPVGTELYLHFSESLCPGVVNPGYDHVANYSVNPPVPITAATLLADQKTVRLDFAPAMPNGNYTLQVATQPNFAIYACTSNQMANPVFKPFTVSGTASGPFAFYTVPSGLSTDCDTLLTVYGSDFDQLATVELIPGPIVGSLPMVNGPGTVITATFLGGIPAGSYSVVVKNPSGAVVFPNQSTPPYAISVDPPTINAIYPLQVGTCDNGTVTALGMGFCQGATIEAVPAVGPTLSGAPSVSPNGSQISGLFNFAGAAPGIYQLVVNNPGGGTASGYYFHVGGVSAWSISPTRVGDCGPVTFSIPGTFCFDDEVQLVPDAGGSPIPGAVLSVGPNLYWSVMTASFDLTSVATGVYHVELKRGANPWFVTGVKVTVLPASPCPLDVEILGRNVVGYTRVNTFTLKVRNISCSPVSASTLTFTVPLVDNPTLSAATGGGVISPANVITYSIPLLNPGDVHTVQFDMLLPNVNTATDVSAVDSVSGCGPVLHHLDVVTSQDPNFKQGLEGVGVNHRILGNETLPYEIHFENLPTATAPAQDVFVTDRLNPAQFDLSTFSLGDFTYGNQTITPPGGLTSFSSIVPFDMDGDPITTGDQALLVVDAKLVSNPFEPDYGRVTWSFRSLDLLTLTEPLDPLLGFLPPNQLPPQGEGSVKFNVKLKPNQPVGSHFGSAAEVIFDSNAPIYTNPWFNEIATFALSIGRFGSGVQLTWLGDPDDWVLEQTPQLLDPVWTPVGITPVSISGGRLRVTVTPLLDEQMFYRLRH